MGWGLRVFDSQDLHVYGAGLYSFFNNYDASQFTQFHYVRSLFQLLTFVQRAACSKYGGQQNCQNYIFSIEGNSAITVYNLNVLGSQSLVDKDGHSLASYSDNIGVFTINIAYFST